MDSFSNGIVALDGLRSRDPCDLDRSVDVRLRPHETAQLDHTLEGCVCSLVLAARTKGPDLRTVSPSRGSAKARRVINRRMIAGSLSVQNWSPWLNMVCCCGKGSAAMNDLVLP
jgi:hypothetical protein